MSKLASTLTLALTLALPFAFTIALGAPRAEAEPRKVTIKAPPLPPSTEDLLIASPQHAAWVPSEKLGMPAGAEVALIGADPISTGPTMYLKARAGWHLPSHWHIHTSYLTLVTGRVTLTIDGKKHALVPGSFVVIPSRAKHELTCAPGAECLLVDRRSGPVDLHWVGAAR
ncbi:MAG TPA: cupin domain-containing protein [Polyangia bacterium]|jgi:mannose-6-phosphate isomerase-like protein (cupin superfamily)